MSLLVHELESRDFTELQEGLSAWDHRYEQIGLGPFYGRFLHTQTGALGVFRNRWERAIHYDGIAPKGAIGIAVTLEQSSEGRWMGEPTGANDLFMQRAAVEAEYLSAPLWDSVVFTVAEEELTRQLADISDEDPEGLLPSRAGVVRLTPEWAARLRRASLMYLEAAVRSVRTPAAPALRPQMADSLVELLARAIVTAQPRRRPTVGLDRQRQLVRRAADWSRHHEPLRIGQLCHELGVSERTLRHAFDRTTGVSPLAYLKTQRLNRVYRSLRGTEPNEVLIKQVAYDNGFYHLGRFSREYKQLFGERPSDTLQRHAR